MLVNIMRGVTDEETMKYVEDETVLLDISQMVAGKDEDLDIGKMNRIEQSFRFN